MPLQMDTIFLGVSKSVQKKFYHSILSELKGSHPTLIIPCVGTFALVEVALSAGYQPANIHTSDISLFSSALGYFLKGQSLLSLPYEITTTTVREEHLAYNEESMKLAHLLWYMKTLQVNADQYYQAVYLKHFEKQKEKIIRDLSNRLVKMRERMNGIKYHVQDLREHIALSDAPDEVTILHVPAYAGGYEKMFDFAPQIRWDPNVPEFSFKDEFKTLYDFSKSKKGVYVWSAYDNVDGVETKDVFFAEERNKNKYEYFCVTKPELLSANLHKYSLVQKRRMDCKPLPIGIVPREFKITDQTKIGVINVTEEQALYYRDLWAHKMGTTKAEQYYLFTLDGMAFGVTGFMTSKAMRLTTEDVFEVFGFYQPIDNHPNAHKLFMMFLTCNDMRNILINSVKRNRIFEISGFRTVCLTKYRKLKSSTGLLNILSREKMDNGNYKILYYTRFWKRTFEETLKHWLENDDVKVNTDEVEDESDAEESQAEAAPPA